MSDKLILSTQLVNGVIGYLGSRPYEEVADLILAVREQVTPQIQVPTPQEQEAPVQ